MKDKYLYGGILFFAVLLSVAYYFYRRANALNNSYCSYGRNVYTGKPCKLFPENYTGPQCKDGYNVFSGFECGAQLDRGGATIVLLNNNYCTNGVNNETGNPCTLMPSDFTGQQCKDGYNVFSGFECGAQSDRGGASSGGASSRPTKLNSIL